MANLLLVDDDIKLRTKAAERLRQKHTVEEAEDGAAAVIKARQHPYDVVITDLVMPNMDGLELMTTLQDMKHDAEVIMATSAGTVENAVAALKLGAFDFVVKPYEMDELAIKIEKALERRKLRKENERLNKENAFLKQIESLSKDLQSSNAELKKKVAELSAIHHIGLLLNSALNEKELFTRLLDFIRRTLQVESAALLLTDGAEGRNSASGAPGAASSASSLKCRMTSGARAEEWQALRVPADHGMFGDVLVLGEPLAINDASDPRFDREVASQLNFPIHSLLVIPLKPQQKSLGVLALANRRDTSRFTQDDIALMMTIAREGSLAIDNFSLRDELREKVRMEEELRVARSIQESFYPAVLPALPGWEWAAKAIPARVVGGDFYWGTSSKEGVVDLAIGDVSGKGIPAALYMAKLLSILQAEALPARTPADIMAAINKRLTEGTHTGMFASMILIRIEGATCTWACAGHPHPFWIRGASGTSEKLSVSSRAVGLTKDSTYENHPLTLASGDSLILYTDGLFETANPSGERFGLPRLLLAAGQSNGRAPQLVIDGLIKEVTSFAPGELQDDLTALVIKKV